MAITVFKVGSVRLLSALSFIILESLPVTGSTNQTWVADDWFD